MSKLKYAHIVKQSRRHNTDHKEYALGIICTSVRFTALVKQRCPAPVPPKARRCGYIAIRLKIQTKSSHKIHRYELLRLDFVNLNSWIAIIIITAAGTLPNFPSGNFTPTISAIKSIMADIPPAIPKPRGT